MAEFSYKAVSQDGQIVTGVLRAGNLSSARRSVVRTYAHVVHITPLGRRRGKTPPVPLSTLLLYTEQFSAMLVAGIPITRSLEMLSQGSHPRMNVVMAQILKEVEGGRPLSACLRDFPQVFSRIYVSLVATAEASGRLHTILPKLGVLLSREAARRKRLTATLSYPCMLLLLGVAVSALIVFQILPVLRPMFNQVGMELPGMTLWLIRITDAATSPWAWALLVVTLACLAWGWRRLLRAGSDLPGGARFKLDSALLRLPMAGRLIADSAASRALFSLAAMLESGINFRDGLRQVSASLDNAALRHRMRASAELLGEGIPLVEALRKNQVFPSGALHVLRAGEEAGRLAPLMLLVAEHLDRDVELLLDGLGSALEPVILGVMGIVIGFICIASILPVLKLVQQF